MEPRCVAIEIANEAGVYCTRINVPGLGSEKAQFEFNLNEDSRVFQVIHKIEVGSCRTDDLKDVGSQLYVGLFSGKVAELFDRVRIPACDQNARTCLRLTIPPELQRLPWEALYDEQRDSFLVSNPNYCIMRDPPREFEHRRSSDANKLPLRVLVVIPEDSGLDVEREWHNLDQTIGKLAAEIIIPEKFEGRVTPDRLQQKLQQSYDILHYIGHGEMGSDETFRIRLNDPATADSEFWVDGETFAALFYKHAPRLVVLNCCMSAAPSASIRGLSGIAPSLLRAGVPAVVAMRYEVPDDVAIRFSDVFYRELLSGEEPGRIDAALANTRHSLYINKREGASRGFITPVLNLAADHEQLFLLSKVPPRRTESNLRPSAVFKTLRESAVPEELLETLRNGECIPIIGPGILGIGATRAASRVLGPVELLKKLASESDYPLSSEPASLPSNEWGASLLFPSICQHFQKEKKRHRLIRVIEQFYQNAEPPEELSLLAGLKVPAIIYTYFDKWLESTLVGLRRSVQTLSAIDRSCELDPHSTLLVYLRGNLSDIDSLVLTEDDHEKLWDRLGLISPIVKELMKGRAGRSSLILGLSPRDLLLKRLSTRVLEASENRSQGPTFFVCDSHSKIDEAYWEKYDVRWIPLPLNQFIEALRETDS